MKKIAGRLRLDLAQFRELEAFAAFGSDLDKASKAALDLGGRMVELLKQPQYSPYSMEREVVSIWSGTSGGLNDVPLEDVRRFEAEFLDWVARERANIMTTIRETKELPDDLIVLLNSALTEFKQTFKKNDGTLLGVEDDAEALPEAEIEHGKVTKRVRKKS